MDVFNILFCGIGGQGIVTSSRILALASMHAGMDVKMSEVHGMAQRGGSVDTHVRIGFEVPSSLIPRGGAHFLVAFEKLEAVRYLDFLRPDGLLLACSLEVPPISLSLKKDSAYPRGLDEILQEKAPRLVWVDAERLANELGDLRMVNVILLGALAPTVPWTRQEHWERAIRERFPERLHEACLKAFNKGVEHVTLHTGA